MGPAWQSSRKLPARRRRLTLALATAEERLVEAYAKGAANFMRATEDNLQYQKSLEIFYRLTGVPDRIREAVSVQALTMLAEEPQPAVSAPLLDLGDGLRGMLQGFARRVRGRKADALRIQVERAAARARGLAEAAYLDGASMLVEALKDEAAPAEAVQLYLDALEIGPGWSERIFHLAVAAAGARDPDGRAETDGRAA